MNKKITQFRWLAATIMLVAAMVMPSVAWAEGLITPSKPTSGDGSAKSPYQIGTVAELYWFAGLVNGTLTDGTSQKRDACATLTADITVNTGVLKSDATLADDVGTFSSWTPIGTSDYDYTGTFDGANHTISGLYFNDSSIDNVGFFGATYNATIKNVGVIDSYFNANLYVGGLIGKNNGTTITNCYFVGSVNGNSIIGGICGYCIGTTTPTITNCYSVASVSAKGNYGGVIGSIQHCIISNCFYNKETFTGDAVGHINNNTGGSTISTDVVGKTTSQFNSGEVAYLLSRGCTIGETFYEGSVWGQDLSKENSYPILDNSKRVYYGYSDCESKYYSNTELSETRVHSFSNGFCTVCQAYQEAPNDKNGVYEISNAGQLYWFVNKKLSFNDVNYSAKLVNDITVNENLLNSLSYDAEGSVTNGDGFRVWSINTNLAVFPYAGTFDGQGHTISGLYFNEPNYAFASGLFVNSSGTIKNVGIIDSYFNGKDNVGGVCGNNSGTIENCYNTSKVGGSSSVGGVCGQNAGGNIINCHNIGAVSGSSDAGGVCGKNSGTITNCYYLANEDDNNGGKTEEQFKSGEVAYLLNNGKTDGAQTWYQNIDKEDVDKDYYPLLDSNGHGTVYQCTNCTGVYSNTENNPGHLFGENDNGFCHNCGAYQSATLTTDKYDIDGNDSIDEVYEISNAGQLYWFAALVNGTLDGVTQNASANAVLTADITVNTGVLNANGLSNGSGDDYTQWTPIGKSFDYAYCGTFDGQGHTIRGLWHYWSADIIGLFGINKGTIKNVGVVDSYLNGYNTVGGVCGSNCGSLTNCYFKGSINGYNNTGGVCGYNDSDCYLTNCYNTGKVDGNGNVGGVCGYNNGYLTNCYNTGNLMGNENVGGVYGWNGGSLSNCYYLAYVEDNNGGKTSDQFRNGEVCYLLNGSSPYGEWGQQIDTDDHPVLGSEYKVLRAAQDGEKGTNYWATFSNLVSNAELTAPAGNVTVYNATVSGGKLTLTERSDDRVAKEEGVLLKANCEYVNAKNISDEVSAATIGYNDLVATPKTAGPITADTGCTLYRLTYNKTTTKEGLGFYLGVVGESKDGSKLNATPGKAYLKVATETVTQVSGAAIRGFAFPGDGETTGIECITVTDESSHRNGNADGIFDLQGRKVSKPTKGVYINNGKKVIIK